jgi:thiol-disulfide isomerase/thioredoxin|tara:strand:+ start:119 stop:664 length:546 start_codon:yes stop_codon:yes gene_type:complete
MYEGFMLAINSFHGVRAVMLTVGLLAAVPGFALAQSGGVSLDLGTQGPGAALEDLAGGTVELLDYVEAGKPTVFEFWATWCEQCEALQPQFDQMQAKHGAEVNIVAVAVGVSQSVRRVNRHLEEHDPGYPYLFDKRGAAVRAYSATTTSIVVMLDRDGKVAYTGVGSDQDLMSAIGRLLGS